MEGQVVTLEELGVEYIPRMPAMTPVQIKVLSEQVYDEFVDYLRSIQGWDVIGGFPTSGGDMAHADESIRSRESYVKRSRILARREPLSKQAIRLYTTYSGILRVSFKSRQTSAETTWQEKFWELPENQRVLGALHRRKLSNRLLIDGELPLVLFPGTDGTVKIRAIDPLQIIELVSHPEDADTVLYYKRQYTSQNPNDSTAKTVYYRDHALTDGELEDAVRSGFELPRGAVVDETARLMFVVFDSIGMRGNGLLFSVLSYIENFRNFLQDRATIVRALSTYIRELTVKGGSKAVSDIATRFRSALASGGYIDTNPPDAPGSTWVQNQNVEKKDTPPVTNAGDAMNDARIMRQPIASGVGITEANLTGDPSIGNLASQTQMEGPQLMNFQDYQFLWQEVLKGLWRFVLDHNGEDSTVDLIIGMPPIVKEPLNVLSTVVASSYEKHFIPYEEAARQVLVALGVEQVDDMIKSATEERDEGREVAQKQFNIPTPTSELNESDAIPGKCPFCGVERLYQEHGICYCGNCNVSFNPGYHETTPELVDNVLTLSSILEEVLADFSSRNGKGIIDGS